MPEEGINPVEFPDVMYGLWQRFRRLNEARQIGMNGPAAISEGDIAAFCQNRRLWLSAWELSVIAALDRVALAAREKPANEK